MWHLHRAQRSDALARDLGLLLRQPPDDPFAREVVAVPTKGVERWLAQRLSHVLGDAGSADGVCALVQFPSPARLVAEALAASQGLTADTDPWRQAALAWSVLAVVDDAMELSWAAPLRRYLLGDGGAPGEGAAGWRAGRRFSLASTAATLLSQYADERPAMVRGWLDGRDDDGAGDPLPDDLLWQPALLRALRARIGVPAPAERLPAACERLRGEPGLVGLPERVSVFGPTRLSTAALQVLAALAEAHVLHLWLPHPSPALWQRLAAEPAPTVPPRRAEDPAAALVRHPLLASLGRDARELQQRLAATASAASDTVSQPVGRPAPGLLGRLQVALADDQPAGPGDRSMHTPSDLSLEVHSCHGRARQVEVLREVLLHRLQADPTLEPRDVLVMCPQVEVYAPVLSAVLGLAAVDTEAPAGPVDAHPGQQLRVSLADRSLRQTNDVLATLDRVLTLAAGRVPVSQVRDLVSLAPVRRRFGFDDDQVELLERWVEASSVRWGLDGGHRVDEGLGVVGQGTWEVGLDRIVLGIAATEHDGARLGHALPLDGVDSQRASLAGRFAELVARLGDVVRGMRRSQPLADWLGLLERVLTELCATTSQDAWMLVSARAALAELAESGDPERVLTLPDVRALLAELLAGRPTRSSFRTGALTVCTMMPMRSVPHRVVFLLGLDEVSFPRTEGTSGDDVLLRRPRVGERDRRSEDRQLLCDALTSATDALVVLYSGRDERTNDELAPAVPVAELLDTADTLIDFGAGGARERLVVHHPLQPFDPRCFEPGALRPGSAFSHDGVALAGAEAGRRPRRAAAALVATPLPLEAVPVVELDDLLRWGDNPPRELVRRRLGIGLIERDDLPPDEIIVEMDALQAWTVGDRLLTDRLRGVTQAEAVGTEWLRGLLPPGRLGEQVLTTAGAKVEQVVAAAAPWSALAAEQVDVDLMLPSGRRLVGSVTLRGSTVLAAGTSRLKAKVRFRAWLRQLALAAARPDLTVDAVLIGGTVRAHLPVGPPLDPAAALDDLIDLMLDSRSRRMPLLTATGYQYASVLNRRPSPALALKQAASEWHNDYGGESADLFVVALWGPGRPVEALLEGAAPDDPGSALATLSLRMWKGMLDQQRDGLPTAAGAGAP